MIGEWISPRPVGTVGRPERESQLPPTSLVLARGVLSIVGLAVLLLFLGIPNGPLPTLLWLAYVVVATLVRPAPDLSNVGWFGGLVDDPFHVSDDLNRFLVVALLVLWPGRMIGSGFILLVRWMLAASRTRH